MAWLVNDSDGYYILYKTAGAKSVAERYDIAPGYFSKKLVSPNTIFETEGLRPIHRYDIIKLVWSKV
jgi:hypothetical protein